MARPGPIEWLGALLSVALLWFGARQWLEESRFVAGARSVDAEVAEVLLGPDQRTFYYVMRAQHEGRELRLTLAGAESRRGAPRAGNRVGDRLRVLYNRSAQPEARWERHASDGTLAFLILGGGLGMGTLGMYLLGNWHSRRRRPARPR